MWEGSVEHKSKDVFVYKTFSNVELQGASVTAADVLGTDTIHDFKVGTDFIAEVMDIGGGDVTFVSGASGSHSGSQTYLQASTNGWSYARASATTGTLTFDSSLATGNGGGAGTEGDFTISLVGVQENGGAATVNDFFMASTAA